MQHEVAADSVALKTAAGLSIITKIHRLNVSPLNTVNSSNCSNRGIQGLLNNDVVHHVAALYKKRLSETKYRDRKIMLKS